MRDMLLVIFKLCNCLATEAIRFCSAYYGTTSRANFRYPDLHPAMQQKSVANYIATSKTNKQLSAAVRTVDYAGTTRQL